MIKIFISILWGVLISICLLSIAILLIYLKDIGYGLVGAFSLSVIIFAFIAYKNQM